MRKFISDKELNEISENLWDNFHKERQNMLHFGKTLSKKELRKISKNGYTYSGFWDNMYHFSKRMDKPYGYKCIKCRKLDIINGNIFKMMELELTL